MQLRNIGEYRVIARLGRGGMADVFLAVRGGLPGFSKLVVLKRLRDDVEEFERSNYEALLVDEACIAARLHHPNIVQTFEVSSQDGVPFLAMEYLDGQSLDHALGAAMRTAAPLEPDLALFIVSEVLAALDYAHELEDYDGTPLGIVHRDVSPHNIFVTYEGEVKLVDFGVAKHMFSSQETALGVVKGKLTYMAPEQAQRMNVDRRADVFAAGVVLWECLALRRLLAAETPAATLHKLLYEPLPELDSVRPDLDPALGAICARALARDPDERYPSAAAMRADLEPLLGDARPRAKLASCVQELFERERRARGSEIKQALAGDVIVNLSPHERSVSLSALPPAANDVAAQSAASEVRLATDSLSAVPTQPRPLTPMGKLGLAGLASLAIAFFAGGAVVLTNHAESSRPAAHGGGNSAMAPALPVDALAPEVVLRLCGSNTIGAELAPVLVESFLQSKGATGVTLRHGATPETSLVVANRSDKPVGIEISAHGSSTAFVGLLQGGCDVGMASRAVSAEEAAAFQEQGLGELRSAASEHVLALDGIAVIVHPNNPLRALDRAALHDIFTGRIVDWKDVGGPAGPIRVLSRDARSGTFDTFKHLVLDKDALASSAALYPENEALADAVASDAAAIGFVGLAYVRTAKALAVGEPGTEPMLPTHFTVATEGYMLSRRLYLYTLPAPRTPWVTEFVSYALSRKAQELAGRSQFVDLGLMMRTAPCVGHCPARYAAAIANAQRISLDFRFRSGSDEPDSRAGRDLERLVNYLSDQSDLKLLLLGFSDVVGNVQANQRLSLERAKAIEHELTMRGVRPSVVSGFGSEMPLASNDSEAGRQKNRRVEVWVQR